MFISPTRQLSPDGVQIQDMCLSLAHVDGVYFLQTLKQHIDLYDVGGCASVEVIL